MAAPPFPPAVWEGIQEFLAEKRSGTILLYVFEGRVLRDEYTYHGRESVRPATAARDTEPQRAHAGVGRRRRAVVD